MRDAVLIGTLICLGYMLAVFGMSAVVLIVSALDNAIRSRETLAEDFDVLVHSRFTPPVSVIVPAYNEEGMVMISVQSVLDFDYPEFEVLIVDDGSTDRTFEVLEHELDLEPFGYYERRIVECAPVTGVYRSRTFEHVKVIRKENQGTKADASNCGLNYARYRYVLLLDGDTIYEPDALLNCMRLMASDPARVIGITGHISVASQPETTVGARLEDRELIDRTLLSNFQHIEYLRSFLNTRLGWSRLGFMMCVSGAFGLWRRDVVEEVGGWSKDFSCEDIELTFRVHEHMRRTNTPYKILSIPEMVARTEAPGRIKALVSQRTRWQRVILETFWHYRKMILNPRYGFVGLVGIPVMLLSEALGLVFELVGFATLVAGMVMGIFSWQPHHLLHVDVVRPCGADERGDPDGGHLDTGVSPAPPGGLLALGPLELFLLRPILIWVALPRHDRLLPERQGLGQFDRNERSELGSRAGPAQGAAQRLARRQLHSRALVSRELQLPVSQTGVAARPRRSSCRRPARARASCRRCARTPPIVFSPVPGRPARSARSRGSTARCEPHEHGGEPVRESPPHVGRHAFPRRPRSVTDGSPLTWHVRPSDAATRRRRCSPAPGAVGTVAAAP